MGKCISAGVCRVHWLALACIPMQDVSKRTESIHSVHYLWSFQSRILCAKIFSSCLSRLAVSVVFSWTRKKNILISISRNSGYGKRDYHNKWKVLLTTVTKWASRLLPKRSPRPLTLRKSLTQTSERLLSSYIRKSEKVQTSLDPRGCQRSKHFCEVSAGKD